MPTSTKVDPELIVDAVMMAVEDKGEGGVDWLLTEHARVLEAVMGGAEFVTQTSFHGESHTAVQQVEAHWLLAILTQARRRITAETSGASTKDQAMLIPRLADFPLN
jgi:hypothetical protein